MHEASTPRTVMVACDLDRTLIYSKNALWLEGADKDAPRLVVSEVYKGSPLSYMTGAAEELLRTIMDSAIFVPVTTRTHAQYQRVQLPKTTTQPVTEYAIVANGGVILHQGEPDLQWEKHIAKQVAANCSPLEMIAAHLSKPEFQAWILNVHNASDLFIYAITDRAAIPTEFLSELETLCQGSGWSTSLQGRKLYCVPNPVNKADALAELARRTNADTVLAAGDSLLDQEMLAHADLAFRPLHGELHDVSWQAPNLQLTDVRGVLAGEQILQQMLAVLQS